MKFLEQLERYSQPFDVELFEIAGTVITTATAAAFALVIVFSWIASLLIQRAISRGFRIRGVTDEGTVGVARRLTHYLIVAIGL